MKLKIIENSKIGVAVSGGVDSMVLLDLYLAAGQKICVVNFDHGLRENSSKLDSAFVENFCKEKNIEFLGFSLDVNLNRKPGESDETAARRLRYIVFENLLSSKTVDYIALAHHADDNAETILMRILRGTGIAGLSGITERGNYLRPLLKYTRAEIEDYAKQNNVPFVTDETNLESNYLRNYLRNEVFPLINARFPTYTEQFSRLASSAREINEYLNAVSLSPTEIYNGCKLSGQFTQVTLLQKYSVKKAFSHLGIKQDIEARHYQILLDLASASDNTSVDMPFGIRATKHGLDLIFSSAAESGFSEKFDINSVYRYAGRVYSFEKGESIVANCSFDAGKLPSECLIRTRLDGDLFKRVNGKTKLLSDFLNEKKLSVPEKDRILVLANGNTVFVVLGIETADSVKIDTETIQITHIKAK